MAGNLIALAALSSLAVCGMSEHSVAQSSGCQTLATFEARQACWTNDNNFDCATLKDTKEFAKCEIDRVKHSSNPVPGGFTAGIIPGGIDSMSVPLTGGNS
jgi:hypothetical protein